MPRGAHATLTPVRTALPSVLLALAVAALVALLDGGATPGPRPAVASAATRAPAAASGHAAARARALKLIWGGNTLPDGSSAFPTYRKLGVDVLQEQLNWARVAARRPANPTDPDDPAYAWTPAVDVAYAEARRAGFEISLMVKETPDWANGGRGIAQAPDRDRDYADFLTAAAKRYTGVRFWMVWGEPTRLGNFTPMPAGSRVGPRRYARLLDAAYVALKAVRRSNQVIGGNTWTVGTVTAPSFVRWLRLPNGKPPRMDLWGHNPYGRRFPRLADPVYASGVRDINDLDTLHGEIARAYRGRKVPRFWLSEFSIASGRPNRAFDFAVPAAEQARWVTAAFRLVNATSYVRGLGWYDLADESPVSDASLTNGLLRADGSRKPSFSAYRRAR